MDTQNINKEKSSKSLNHMQDLSINQRILSAAGGAFLVASGIRIFTKPSASSILRTLLGGYLVYRGVSGRCPVTEAITGKGGTVKPLKIKESMTINRPRREVYMAWRRFENLPRFMKHLSEVREVNNIRSHWEARIPGGIGTIEWDADITDEREGEVIAWHSVKDAAVDNAGKVTFHDAPGGRGTELNAVIAYQPPAGQVGSTVAKMFNNTFESMIREDLRRFKRMMETGEIATIEGQPTARNQI